MSKPNATLAVLATLSLCCIPSVAATIASDETPVMVLGGDAEKLGANLYSIKVGQLAMVEVKTEPGDQLLVFAAADDGWGKPDYSNVLPLFFGIPRDGKFLGFFQVPAELAGNTIHLQALAVNPVGRNIPKASDILTVMVKGSQVLMPSTDPSPTLGTAGR